MIDLNGWCVAEHSDCEGRRVRVDRHVQCASAVTNVIFSREKNDTFLPERAVGRWFDEDLLHHVRSGDVAHHLKRHESIRCLHCLTAAELRDVAVELPSVARVRIRHAVAAFRLREEEEDLND